jgi:hypothetical protein
MPVTADRADVLHFAGRHRLSPAVRAGEPLLVPAGETAGRCGWAPFFEALRARGLALSFEPADAAFTFVRARGAQGHPSAAAAAPPSPSSPSPGPGRGGGALAEARRFLAALRGRPAPPA